MADEKSKAKLSETAREALARGQDWMVTVGEEQLLASLLADLTVVQRTHR
jgi:hypothetical protein